MLIEAYEIKVTSPPCEPGSERWSAFAILEADIGEVLPYLNAVWPDAIYDHTGQVLTRRARGHAVAIRPHELAVSNVLDRNDAERLVDELIAEVNDIWARRDEVVPRTNKRQRPTAMELYRLLPRTNCKACGQPTCWTFALLLATGDADLGTCTPLGKSEYARQQERLHQLLAGTSSP
jgi:ArsR family metal-binding transcriptional regulator